MPKTELCAGNRRIHRRSHSLGIFVKDPPSIFTVENQAQLFLSQWLALHGPVTTNPEVENSDAPGAKILNSHSSNRPEKGSGISKWLTLTFSLIATFGQPGVTNTIGSSRGYDRKKRARTSREQAATAELWTVPVVENTDPSPILQGQ